MSQPPSPSAAARAASTAHSSGLKSAAVSIQSGISDDAMKVDEMNDSGSWRKVSVAISVSSLRALSANPTRACRKQARSGPRRRPAPPRRPARQGNVAPASSEIPTMISDWNRDRHRVLRHAARQQRATADRRYEQPVGDPSIEVLDHRHATPAGREEGRHHHDPGRQYRHTSRDRKPGCPRPSHRTAS